VRAVLILCSVLVLSACGSSSKSSQPATQPQPKVPPGIESDTAEETLSRAQIRLLRCGDQVPPALPGQEGTSKRSRLHECLQRAVPK